MKIKKKGEMERQEDWGACARRGSCRLLVVQLVDGTAAIYCLFKCYFFNFEMMMFKGQELDIIKCCRTKQNINVHLCVVIIRVLYFSLVFIAVRYKSRKRQ